MSEINGPQNKWDLTAPKWVQKRSDLTEFQPKNNPTGAHGAQFTGPKGQGRNLWAPNAPRPTPPFCLLSGVLSSSIPIHLPIPYSHGCLHKPDAVKISARRDVAADHGPGRSSERWNDKVVHVIVTQIRKHGVHGILPAIVVKVEVFEGLDPVDLDVELILHVGLETLNEEGVFANASPEQYVVGLSVSDVLPTEPFARHRNLPAHKKAE